MNTKDKKNSKFWMINRNIPLFRMIKREKERRKSRKKDHEVDEGGGGCC
jgi:hypothetical protein